MRIKLFFFVVNNSPPRTFIFMDDDFEEINVNTTIANMTLTGDLINPVKSTSQNQAVAEGAEFEDLAVLFRNHHKSIFRIAYRITGSQSDAEDVLQTIFLRLAPNRHDLSQNPQAYLHRAAINASLDFIRSRTRRHAVSLDVVDFEQKAEFSATNPADALEDVELRELIRQAVAKLEGRAAAAFALRYFEDYDNKRIANILGTSQMVVAVTLHRARTRLRKEIGSYLEKNYEA